MKALVQQGVVHIDAEPYFRRPVHYTGQPQPIPALTPAQEQVFDGLKELLRAPDAQAALLAREGVTLRDAQHVDLRRYQWQCE